MKAKEIELVSVTKTLGKKEDTREGEEQNTEKKKQKSRERRGRPKSERKLLDKNLSVQLKNVFVENKEQQTTETTTTNSEVDVLEPADTEVAKRKWQKEKLKLFKAGMHWSSKFLRTAKSYKLGKSMSTYCKSQIY